MGVAISNSGEKREIRKLETTRRGHKREGAGKTMGHLAASIEGTY